MTHDFSEAEMSAAAVELDRRLTKWKQTAANMNASQAEIRYACGLELQCELTEALQALKLVRRLRERIREARSR
jgi:hypothetical protein